MLRRNRGNRGRQAQVLLETAIVFVSLALLAIGSMRLFSNLNKNLIDRMQRFRESRNAAVNNLAFIEDPVEYLDYYPNSQIDDDAAQDYDDYGDERVRMAHELMREGETIMDETLPGKLRELSDLLLSEPIAHTDEWRDRVEAAIPRCEELLYDGLNPYQEHAFWKYFHAKNYLKKVIEDPNAFMDYFADFVNPNTGDTSRRDAAISGVKDRLTDTKTRIEELIDLEVEWYVNYWKYKGPLADQLLHQLQFKLWDMVDYLYQALEDWDTFDYDFWFDKDWTGGFWLNKARNELKKIMDYLGLTDPEAIAKNIKTDINVKIMQTRQFLTGEVTNTELADAIKNCVDIAKSNILSGEPLNLVNSAKQDLLDANTFPNKRQRYIDSARNKLEQIDVTTAGGD